MLRIATIIVLLAGCRKAAEPPPAQPAAGARFCDQDLSGVWLNASDRHFAYRFTDHGDVVRGQFMERSDDGGLSAPADPITFEFKRTKDAMQGAMHTTQRTQGGRDCPVEFGMNITACHGQSLQAEVEMDAIVAENCQRQKAPDGGELPTHRTEFVFVRDGR